MNYIYDIVLNFQDNYYNFFEWHKDDKIKNIPKIPLYRVTDKDIKILKNNKVKVSQSLIESIKNYNKRYKKNICLVSNGKIAIGLLFKDDGTLSKRSSLIFEEEEEVIEVVRGVTPIEIKYIENIEIIPQNKLRVEKEKKEILINYIKNTTDIVTLKYLYYEYYEQENTNPIQIKKALLKELTKEWNIKQNNLYDIVNLLNKVK